MRAKIFRGIVLLVTNDEHLQNSFQRALLHASYGIRIVGSQEEAIRELQRTTPAILVVDRRESGFSRLRQEMPNLPPIVTITYHRGPCDDWHCAMDLDDGATRAVCNASPALIVALLGATLRRQQWERPTPTHYVAHGVTVDLENCDVKVGTTPVHLSRTEFRIFQTLITTPGHCLSREALLALVWGKGFAILPHALDVHISSLRRKLNPARRNPELIMTVKGIGFKLRSTALSDEVQSTWPSPSELPAIQPLVSRAHRKRTRAASVAALAATHWQPQPGHSISARYRTKPVASGQDRQKPHQSVHAIDPLS
jgi:DNA-binding response OmpR family regulator